jgi:DNA repair protein RadA/Sms
MKSNTYFVCSNPDCDKEPTKKWFGLCSKCKSPSEEKEEENILIKGKTVIKSDKKTHKISKKMNDIDTEHAVRIDTGITQVNTIFGKNTKNNKTGIAIGSLNLLSGHPGVGKSTLLLSIIDNIEKQGIKCLYITGEESETQIKDRAERLELNENISVLAESDYMKILPDIEDHDFIIIDSINTIYIEGVGIVGGISQINEVTTNIMKIAKKQNKTFLLIAQINGQGDIAGPKRLEHMVDAVFFFDDFDDTGIFKIITSEKNRFGKVNETAIFEMTETGMKEIADPSMIFLENTSSFGTALSLIFKGNRPILIEIESLVSQTQSENTFTAAIGIDQKKVTQLIAVLSKYMKWSSYQKNIFSNVVGGINLTKGKPQTQIDLAIFASILSSDFEKKINDYIFIGEVTLSGNIRKVPKEQILIDHVQALMKDKKVISNSTGYKNVSQLTDLFK